MARRRIQLKGNPRGINLNRIGKGGTFAPGNQLSTLENMSPEGHAKRMAAAHQAWKTKALRAKGVEVKTTEVKRQRVRLRETIVREAREIQEIARMAAGDAMECLKNIITDGESRTSDKLTAISLLLDRAYGKATQTNVNANVDANGKEADVSTAELQRRIDTALNRIEAVTGGTGQAGTSEDRSVDLREHDRDPNSSTKH